MWRRDKVSNRFVKPQQFYAHSIQSFAYCIDTADQELYSVSFVFERIRVTCNDLRHKFGFLCLRDFINRYWFLLNRFIRVYPQVHRRYHIRCAKIEYIVYMCLEEVQTKRCLK